MNGKCSDLKGLFKYLSHIFTYLGFEMIGLKT